MNFASRASDLLCPYYEMTRDGCYPVTPLNVRLAYLRSVTSGIECDVKYEYNNNVAHFFQCVVKIYLNTPYNCGGFFHSLSDSMFAVLVLTIENDIDLIDRVFDDLGGGSESDDCESTSIDDDPIVDMFCPEYIEEEKRQLRENMVLYTRELGGSRAVPILAQEYTSHMDNYSAYAHRLPLIIEVIAQIPRQIKIFAPGDGIGVVSIACLALNRDYWSSEPNAIGDRAYELGIIKSKQTYESFSEYNYDGVVILSNLARYCDLTSISKFANVVVIDELCYFPGCEFVPIIPHTYNRIRSTLPIQVVSNFFDGINKVDALLPIIDTYVTPDPRAFVAMERLGYKISALKGSTLSKFVDTGDGKIVTYNFVSVTKPSDFIITYRKKAGAQCGRPGQMCFFEGVFYRFSRVEYIRCKGRGFEFRTDHDYRSSIVLRGLIPTYEPAKYVLGFEPSKLKYAQLFRLIVSIRVVSFKKVKNKYECIIVRYDDYRN